MVSPAVSVIPSSRIKALREKHAELSSRIDKAQKFPSSTDYYLRKLKKQKLLLKEEIESIKQVSTGS